jgi:hypothetical protein
VLVSESWRPGIGVQGPPSGANNFIFRVKDWYQCDTLADLRSLETHYDGEIRMAILRGRDAKFDGLLQGIYCSVPNGQHRAQSDSDAWVIVNDGNSAWQRLI